MKRDSLFLRTLSKIYYYFIVKIYSIINYKWLKENKKKNGYELNSGEAFALSLRLMKAFSRTHLTVA